MAQAEAHTLHPAAGATDAIITFASGMRYQDLSDEVRYYARRHLLDTIGVMIAGAPGDVATNAETMLASVRVGGNIQAPKKMKDVNPVYPPIAQSARVQGVVILEATIGPDGRVQDVKVLRSIPLLDASAIEAVKQWVYTPTMLNNVPVPVIMTVTVNFTLR